MTFHIDVAAPADPAPTFVAPRASVSGAPIAGQTNVTVDVPFNSPRAGKLIRVTPVSYRQMIEVESVEGERMHVRDLDGFDSYADGYLVGADLTIARIVNGVWTIVADTTVDVCAVRESYPVRGIDGEEYLPASATSVTFAWHPRHRPNAQEYIAVAAVGADGRVSGWSNVVAVTTGATLDAEAPSITTEDAIDFVREDVDSGLAVPTNCAATTADGGNSHTVTWTASAGAAGYIVHRSQYPDFIFVNYIEATDTISPQAGDCLIVRKEMTADIDKADWVSNRLWGFSAANGYSFYSGGAYAWGDQAPDLDWSFEVEDGVYFLRLTHTGTGTLEIDRASHAGSGADPFYPVLIEGRTYRQKLRVRSPDITTLTASMQSVADDVDLTLTSGWQTHEADFAVTSQDTSTATRFSGFRFDGPGVLDIAEWSIGDAAFPIPGATAITGAVLSKVDMMRGHHTIKTRPQSYDLGGLIGDPHRLPLLLQGARYAGHSRVWLQVEPHLSGAEIAGLMEYLCTPYDPATDTPAAKPHAHVRYQQGQTAPWADVFTKVYFEIGNEMWNGLSEFYTMPSVSGNTGATSAGCLGNWWKTQMRAHPDFDDDKFVWVVGGRSSSDQWNEELAGATDSQLPAHLTIADYNGGWDEGAKAAPDPTSDDDWLDILFNSALKERAEKTSALVARANARGWTAGTYEAGPGYVLDGLNGGAVTQQQKIDQSQMMKSVAAGTATFAAWLTNAANGFAEQNFFRAGSDAGALTWHSHSPDVEGGAVTPAYQWVADFWNRHIAGGRVVPLDPQRVATSGRAITIGEPEVLSWRVARDGTDYVVVANLSIADSASVLITAVSSGQATRHWMTGDDYQTHNQTLATKDDCQLQSEAVTVTGGKLTATIPPGFVEVFEMAP
ncbi:hypothetical protein [Jannaschia sp. 2305UL9-9]|uniref:hypothetical protein n=1 Tax=Jannaschia sp. 2305UL9-9 TaxID=3121638 RepID=UPI0035274386